MKLNKNELIVGGAFGLAHILFIGFWAIALAPVTALLWALGGAGHKWARRFAMPAIVAVAWLIVRFNVLEAIAGGSAAVGLLSIGYGIPSFQPLDAGSGLGRFWYAVAQKFILMRATAMDSMTLHKKASSLAMTLTRSTIYIGLAAGYALAARLL